MDSRILAVLDETDTHEMLRELVSSLGVILPCERCGLFLRNPINRLSKLTHLWYLRDEHRLIRANYWHKESPTLATNDPMFRKALIDRRALFISDISTENPGVVNVEYELANFGHKALIHAPIHFNGKMYGILEACVFEKPRMWTNDNRKIITYLQENIAPRVASYVLRRT